MEEPSPGDGPQHTPEKQPPPASYIALSELTARLASFRVARSDQFEAMFERIRAGRPYLSIETLARFTGIAPRRLRELRAGERPRIGEYEILEAFAVAVSHGASLELAAAGVRLSLQSRGADDDA